MGKKSIGKHLEPYSIYKKRRTTINHAFASAIAPSETYNEARLDEALKLLGQDPTRDLNCVYCDAPADTWDHLVGLVKSRGPSGHGHQLHNLVPCCKSCNSKKGGKAWEDFLQDKEKRQLIKLYIERCRDSAGLRRTDKPSQEQKDIEEYYKVRDEIFRLMSKADTIAAKIRGDADPLRRED